MNNETKTLPNTNSEEVDKKAQSWYNNNKDEQGVVRVNTRNLKPLYDPRCNHDFYLDEEDGDSSWAQVYKCRHCPVGQLVRRDS